MSWWRTVLASRWRGIFKWFLRLLTRKCELERVCELERFGAARTCAIEKSLRLSKNPELRLYAEDPGTDVGQAVEHVLNVKQIVSQKNISFAQAFGVCLSQIASASQLLEEVEERRGVKYSEENEVHEKLLLQLWTALMPGQELQSRHTSQWGEIGFQGTNPATDFRGMGLLSLENLVYFSTEHGDVARKVLSHSHHPKLGYSFAVVGINLTSLALELLREGSLRRHLYSEASKRKIDMKQFHEVYCTLFQKFSAFWRDEEPENVMAFNAIRAKFKTHIINQLEETCQL
ncbi:ELMO domain-containing protein 2-like [Oscarella lobularis]|uniref:ELMO domain-containing protein 2-like n=1 Tax=Oscarella lobularis TaxID=121494 RepID=UPI003313F675